MQVTDEMIETACAHHWPGPWPGDRSEQVLAIRREDMRLALTAALSDQEPVACACCGKSFGNEGPYCRCAYTHRDWKKNTLERPHRVTNYGLPHREGEDSAEVIDADPTEDMIDAALAVDWECDGDERAAAINVWHAMRSAALAATRSASASTAKGCAE